MDASSGGGTALREPLLGGERADDAGKTNKRAAVTTREPLLGGERVDDEAAKDNKRAAVTTLVFDLEGLTCAACVHTAQGALENVAGIENARIGLFPAPFLKVDLTNQQHFQQQQAIQAIVGEIESVGFGCAFREAESRPDSADQQSVKRANVFVRGIKLDEEALAGSGVHVLSQSQVVSNDETKLEIEYDTRVIRGKRDLLACFESFDRDVRVESGDAASKMKEELDRAQYEELARWRNRTVFAAVFAIPALIISMGPGMAAMGKEHENTGLNTVIPRLNLSVLEVVMAILTTPVMFISGFPFHRDALSSLKTCRLGMAFLVSLGSTSAYLFSWLVLLRNAYLRSRGHAPMHVHDDFETCALLIAFVVLGKYLESLARFRTSEAITGLASLRPATAMLIDPLTNSEREISWDLIQVGDVLRCALGARIPADGVVEEGHGFVDQSALTGESLPVEKQKEDILLSGSLLRGGGGLLMRVTSAGEDSTLSGIIKLVENAQLSKSPVERFADEISKRFVPFIVFLAVLTCFVWALIVQFGEIGHPQHGIPNNVLPFIFGLSVLVVACPCALGLATPTAIMVGSGIGAANGVLIKSGSALEALASVDCIVFDKTGTLTKGELRVEHLRVVSRKASEESVLHLAATAERNSDHPIAKAICRHYDERSGNRSLAPAKDMQEFEGKGVRCIVDGARVSVGSLAMFDAVPQEVYAVTKDLEARGCTSILVHSAPLDSKDTRGEFLGAIGLRDESKEDAAVGVAALRAMGCDVFMITGDNFTTAHVVASEVGIDPQNVLANVLPSEKAAAIRALQHPGDDLNKVRRVAMVGDGVNDAPALAASDCGLAIGAGTQIAIESADMILINSRIGDVVVALDLARVVLRRIRMNYAWALVYNVLGLIFASGLMYPVIHTVVPPWVAAGAMAFSSVSVVLSSLLLRRYRRPKLEPGFRTHRNSMVVAVDSVRVETFDGNVLTHYIAPGCGMLEGEACTCDPAKCTCVLCKHHGNEKQLEA